MKIRDEVCMKSHHLGSAEGRHLNASMVMAVEVKAVERGQQPEIDTGDPNQHCVLETLGQVWVGCVPGAVPVLQKEKIKLRFYPPIYHLMDKCLRLSHQRSAE